jgi:DNA-binding MarR family transcriptional regulator
MKEYQYDKLDTIFHSRIRLAITAALVNVEEIEFTTLKDIIKATDGNMNSHLKKMEDAGYISVKKEFINRKPKTIYSLTKNGRKKFEEYIKVLESFIQ